MPRSQRGRGDSVNLSIENLADLTISLLCPEAKFAPTWVKRFGNLVSKDGDGTVWTLRSAINDQIERHRRPDKLKHGGIARLLACYDDHHPYVDVDFMPSGDGLLTRMNFAPEVDAIATELRFQVNRSTILSGHVFELLAEWTEAKE